MENFAWDQTPNVVENLQQSLREMQLGIDRALMCVPDDSEKVTMSAGELAAVGSLLRDIEVTLGDILKAISEKVEELIDEEESLKEMEKDLERREEEGLNAHPEVSIGVSVSEATSRVAYASTKG